MSFALAPSNHRAENLLIVAIVVPELELGNVPREIVQITGASRWATLEA